MKYNAMPGSIIIRIPQKEDTTVTASGIVLANKQDVAGVVTAEVLSVGDTERTDVKVGDKIVFPTSSGLLIDKNIYYLKYDDICAVIA